MEKRATITTPLAKTYARYACARIGCDAIGRRALSQPTCLLRWARGDQPTRLAYVSPPVTRHPPPAAGTT